jgi:hypothetical protein
MIRYALTCSNAHAFEAWFRSAEDFDGQRDRGLLSCPACGDGAVSKALMAPAVVTRRAPVAEAVPAPVPGPVMGPGPAMGPGSVPAALPGPPTAEFLARLRALKAEMLENSEDVGQRFAEEARRIHYGEAPTRTVHGQASLDDARALLEEGVGILPLPVLPDERN